jgi:hypothetical protein
MVTPTTAPNTKPAHPHPALILVAPLVELAVAAVLLEVPVGVVDVVEGIDVGPADALDEPPRGAVDSPAISDRTVEEKAPVMLVRLFRLKKWSNICE